MTIATDDALVTRPVDPVARRQTLITGWLLIGLAVFVALVFGTQVEGNATFRLSLPRDAVQVPNLVVPAAPFIYIVAAILAYFVRLSLFSGMDRFLGFFFGLLRGVVLLGVFAILGQTLRLDGEPWWKGSKLMPYGEGVASGLRTLVGDTLEKV